MNVPLVAAAYRSSPTSVEQGKDWPVMRESEGLYIISVAARLLEMHQQTLRKYEREGFIRPQRTSGNLRLYSVADVERLRQIKYLVDGFGMNLEGVEAMLKLTHRLKRLYRSLPAEPALLDPEILRAEVAQMLALLGSEPDPSEVEPPRRAGGGPAAESLGGQRDR